jgi:hypothetical protein
MKIVIAGSRNITNTQQVFSKIANGLSKLASGLDCKEITVISGGARGIDTIGEEWAKVVGSPIKRFLPNWNTYGKKAGYLRNKEMIKEADALIAIWDGKSPGTRHIIALAKFKGIPMAIYIMEDK